MGQRLSDPEKLVDASKLAELETKLSECITRMLASKEQGGNPFLFALTASKTHQLTKGWPGQALNTAATDGKQYYWCPEFLDKLPPDQVRVVIEHEAYHNVFFHTHADRVAQKHPYLWNIAVDYVVNTVILVDRTGAIHQWGSGYGHNYDQAQDAAKVFKQELGTAIELEHLIEVFKGKRAQPAGSTIFADKKTHTRTADGIYDELMDALKDQICGTCGGITIPQQGGKKQKGQGGQGQQPGQGQGQGKSPGGQGQGQQPGQGQGGQGQGHGHGDGGPTCPGCGHGFGSMDTHITSKQSREEAIWEALKAADVAKAMGKGNTPSGISEWLKELGEPTLRPADIIRMAIQKRRSNSGYQKDYKRYRRRGLALRPHPEYIPRFYELRPRWLAMLDTSGSHDERSMARGVKELKLVGADSEGLIVPCDAQPYWDKATKVQNIDDLKRVNATGRGGTVFVEFFEGIRKHTPGPWDVVVVITDGECDDIPMKYHPGCDVLWLITNTRVNFKPSFGRLIHLKE